MAFFSIVICTYNPDLEIFQRLLKAVLQFDKLSVQHEVIIIDNNSSPALQMNDAVQSFLSSKQNATIITETKPGLTNARIAGIKAAKCDWIIFFDDDNEPAADYLMCGTKAIELYPHVGAWEPGNIDVKYLCQKSNNYLDSIKAIFQQRESEEICFDNNKINGNICYPYGTGMIIRKEILTVYINEVEKNLLTMSDRKGSSLLSGGDSQMLYIGLRMGFYAGSAPSIKLTHNILPIKTKLVNVLKLVYSVNAGQIKAYNEVFPLHPYTLSEIKNSMLFKNLYIFIRQILRRPLKLKTALLDLSRHLGMAKAQLIAGNKNNLSLLGFWESVIGF